MSKVKKNVYQEFMQEDFIPEGDQYIVKYVAGRGNNLHEVEDIEGSTYLVSMPKKFRQTVWLKKNDCIVIDPIAEGKKVLGEIVCVIPLKNVINLIQTGEWCPKTTSSEMTKDAIIDFFKKHLISNNSAESDNYINDDMIPPSESEDDDEDEDEEEDGPSDNEEYEDAEESVGDNES